MVGTAAAAAAVVFLVVVVASITVIVAASFGVTPVPHSWCDAGCRKSNQRWHGAFERQLINLWGSGDNGRQLRRDLLAV